MFLRDSPAVGIVYSSELPALPGHPLVQVKANDLSVSLIWLSVILSESPNTPISFLLEVLPALPFISSALPLLGFVIEYTTSPLLSLHPGSGSIHHIC